MRSKTQGSSPSGVVFSSLGQVGDKFDEDCLTLNVWSKPDSGEKSKAVLMWIYGGGFTMGNSASPTYNGAKLAEEHDVVVVSMNYRLNIFGFPGAPGLDDQNLGLLDQRLAVEWVRDNIASFGGDPKRITIFGQSAGGASVDMYAYAWTKDPIVNGLIPESGTASMGDMLGGTGGNKSANFFQASQKLGCGGADVGEKAVDCMRTKSWTEVVQSIKAEGIASNTGGIGTFGPIVDNKIVFSDYRARAAAGNFIKRPMLVGNNANELSLFVAVLGQTMNLQSPILKMANGAFTCPSADAAKTRADNKVKTWRYIYQGEWSNQEIAKGAGAFHGAEIPMVFGTNEHAERYYFKNVSAPNTAEQKKLSKAMMTAWTTFAKDPENGLEKLGWPVYDPSKPTLIQLGGANSSTIQFVAPNTVDSSCRIVNSVTGLFGSVGLSGLTGLLGGTGKGTSGLGGLAGLLGGFGAAKGS